MSVIANFKKRREQRKNNEQPSVEREATQTPAPENEALWLLGKLFNCSNELAISAAEEFVGKGLHIVDDEVHMFAENPHYFDPANGDDKTVIAQITTDDAGNITAITESVNDAADSVNQASDSVNDAADSVSHAANKVDQSASAIDDSASNINDSASDLAYSADSIANAANDIKEATSELKKPSAAPKSSPGVKSEKAKNNSKK
jgi:hypothetical protein